MRSLSYKIGLGYVVIIAINIAIAMFSIYHINQLGSPVDRILQEKYQNVTAAENMALALEQQNRAVVNFIETPGDSSLLNNFATYRNEFWNWHQRAIEGIALPGEPLILDSLRIVYGDYLSRIDTLQLLLRDTPQTAAVFNEKVIIPRSLFIRDLSDRLKQVNENAIREADVRARAVSRNATAVIVSIAALAILLSIAASVWFTRSILKPVKETTETVRRISRGYLNQKIDITTDDEIAELGREFNKMTERLHEYEQMNIQQILQEKQRSETIVTSIPAAVIVTDTNHHISLMNDRARLVLGISGEEWRNRPVGQVITDAALVELITAQTPVATAPGEMPKFLLQIQRDGETLFYAARQIDIPDHNDGVLGRVTLLQDVTRFKNLDRMKSEFMATISHEFKTPLTSINMTIDILTRESRGELNAAQRELLSDAKQDCQRLRLLVTDLLDLSRLESGAAILQPEPVSLPQILEKAMQSLRFLIDEKSIFVQTDCPASLPQLFADAQKLSRVLTNLIENAVQHTPPGGTIIISATALPEKLQICVADSGNGIPEAAIDVIFDKFVQVKNFQNAEKGNIGLGLAIAREIVQAHGGQIWAESTEGKGSKFYFTMPVNIGN